MFWWNQMTFFISSCCTSYISIPYLFIQLEGVTIISKKLKETSQVTEFLGSGLKFDAVIDNNSKDVEQASAITDAVKVGQLDIKLTSISNSS